MDIDFCASSMLDQCDTILHQINEKEKSGIGFNQHLVFLKYTEILYIMIILILTKVHNLLNSHFVNFPKTVRKQSIYSL